MSPGSGISGNLSRILLNNLKSWLELTAFFIFVDRIASEIFIRSSFEYLSNETVASNLLIIALSSPSYKFVVAIIIILSLKASNSR